MMDMTRSALEIETWLRDRIAELSRRPAADISAERRFDHYGLDSAAALGLTGELEVWLDRPVDPSLIYECPTIKSLAGRLAVDE
jgi:acyl carrier protein